MEHRSERKPYARRSAWIRGRRSILFLSGRWFEKSVGGPENGVGEEPSKLIILKILGHTEGGVKNATAVCFAHPGDGFRVIRGGGGEEERDVLGQDMVFVKFSGGDERFDSGEDRMAFGLVLEADAGGFVFPVMIIVTAAKNVVIKRFDVGLPVLERMAGGADSDDALSGGDKVPEPGHLFGRQDDASGEDDNDIRRVERLEARKFVAFVRAEDAGAGGVVIGFEKLLQRGERLIGLIFGGGGEQADFEGRRGREGHGEKENKN